ncbi:hypothetical protein QFE97_12125 [Bacillus subtilis]|nr:hypothetical protein QFE97_12125 [Bacillus subtilis]
MIDGTSEAQRLLAEIEIARSEGTMSTLRHLQTETFKFMRSANTTKYVSLEHLRVLRGFLRDPFAQPRRTKPRQPTTNPQLERSDPNAKSPRAEDRILYYNHPDGRDLKRPLPRQYQHRPREPKTRNSLPEIEEPTTSHNSLPVREQSFERSRRKGIPTPAIFADKKQKPLAQRSQVAPKVAANPQPFRQTQAYANYRGRYSTYITFPNSKGHTIREHINEWLVEKEFLPKFGETYEHRIDGKKAIASMVNTVDNAIRYSELRIIEDTDGMFTTTITMGNSPDDCWVYIEVESANNYYPQIPRIARRLIGYGTVDNSWSAWHSKAHYVDTSEIDDVFKYLTSADRRLPVFVIGTTDDAELIKQYRENLKIWYRFLPGTAAMFMLSPSATEELASRVPGSYSPSPWAIRTYRPYVDFEDEHDSSRHRFIGQYRLSTEEQTRTRNRLGMIASEARAQVPRPSVLARAQRTIDLARNRALLRGADHRREEIRDRSLAIKEESRGNHTIQFEQLTRAEYDNFSMLRELLKVESVSEDLVLDLAELYETRPNEEVLARLDGMTEELTAYRAQADELRSLNEYYLNEARGFEDDLEQTKARLRFVQKELAAAGKPEEAYSFAEDEDLFEDISSFTDLEQLLPSLEPEGVVFTGDITTMLNIDEIDSDGTAIRRALMSLRCLLAYREQRISGNHESSLFYYLQNPSGGYSVTPKMFAPRESESTMNQYGDERKFPVPHEVNEKGKVVMEAHFKLGQIGMRSPRMHFLDDVSRTKNIYIGYIGDHLTTSKTN